MIKKSTISMLLLILLSSCSFFSSKTNIEKSEGSAEVKKIMIDKFGGDIKIQEVVLLSQQELNTTMDIIQVQEAGSGDEIKALSYITTYDKLSTDKAHNFDQSGNGILISDIPEDLFYKNAQKVIAQTPKDMEYNSIKSYTQKFSANKPAEAEIVIHATPISGSTTLKGKKLETTYYEYTYIIDAEGNTTMRKE